MGAIKLNIVTNRFNNKEPFSAQWLSNYRFLTTVDLGIMVFVCISDGFVDSALCVFNVNDYIDSLGYI